MNNLDFGYLLFGISSFLFILGSVFKTSREIRIVLLAIWSFSVFQTICNYVVWELTGSGFNESIPFHIRFGMEGAGISDFYKLIVLVSALLLTLGLIALAYLKFWLPKHISSSYWGLLILLQVGVVAAHPLAYEIWNTYRTQASPLANFNEHYITPSPIDTSAKGYNIVWIYAESIEHTYFYDSIFPGLLPNLRALENQSLSFTNVRQVNGTGWTIAGIVASQCGVPLATMGMNGNELARMKYFLPGAVGTGDILHTKKYNQVFMQGSDTWFAGTGKYLNTHKFHTLALSDFKDSIDETNDVVGWGITDDKLFDFARSQYRTLNNQRKPFALMLCTINTHHPDGHVPASCKGMKYGDGSNPILNAVHCSDSLIGAFVRYIRAIDTLNQTIIVISSDHLAMPNTASELLEPWDRTNMLMFNLPGTIKPELNDRPASMLDAGVTALDLSGLPYQKIGLGRSLIRPEKTLVEKFPENHNAVLKSWEGNFNYLWKP